MSKRRQPGDIVWKEPGAGFIGQAFWGYIPLGSQPDDEPCRMCDDPECREWPDVWRLPGETFAEAWASLYRGDFRPGAHHVPECCLLDQPE